MPIISDEYELVLSIFKKSKNLKKKLIDQTATIDSETENTKTWRNSADAGSESSGEREYSSIIKTITKANKGKIHTSNE